MTEAASPAGEMGIFEHLAELRDRIIKSVLAIAAGAVVAFVLYPQIIDILVSPYREICRDATAALQPGQCDGRLIVTDPLEGFRVRMQIAGYGGLVIALPIVLWQVWRFITPGLNPNEKRFAVPFVLSSVVLFVMGAAFALWSFPRALDFLARIGGEDITPLYSPGNYLSLITFMMLAFGIGFEFPIVLIFLQLAGVLPTQKLRDWRRPAIIMIVVAAAIITPSGDPFTLLALSGPMYIFYEVSIIIGRFLKKS
ncbi:MAG TPA: twin-arginine translocase subunit TatC [Acidimicrobiales bacterium]|jgi:sec-independent protein translocase protein TatC